jgi:uncharacterized repeat protein (TIGR02543 family)
VDRSRFLDVMLIGAFGAMAALFAACSDSDVGVDCVPGGVGCACEASGACDDGLSCTEGLCEASGAEDAAGASDATLSDALAADAGPEADAPAVLDFSGGEVAGPDAAPPSCGDDPAPDLCPCRESADCASGFCLPSRDGGSVCTNTCDGSCPEGFQCRFVTLPSLDPTYLCVEPALNLCRPCTDDAECQRDAPGASGARCVRYSDAEGSFCGTSCATDDDCPADYACEDALGHASGSLVRQCVLRDPEASCACSGRSIEGSAFTTCRVDRCDGTRLCDATGLTACTDPDGVVCAPSVAVAVSFDAQGGVVLGDAIRTVWLGEPYGPLPEASLDGWELAGWRTLPSGAGDAVTPDTLVTIRDAHTLHAAWTARRFVVSFDAAGGSPCEPITLAFGAPYGAAGPLCTPTRFGFVFGGWRLPDGAAVTDATLVGTPINHVLTAHWDAAVMTVAFDSEGGGPCDSRSVTYGQTYGAEGPLCAPTRAGHVFAGWFDGDNGSGNPVTATSTVTLTTNHTVFARWEATALTVTFEAAGGSEPVPATRTVRYGLPYGQLATTARAGYIFGGWWTAAGGGGAEVTPTSLVEATSDHALHALWRANSYLVTFDAQGGLPPTPATRTVVFGAAYGALPPATRDGWSFLGWVSADGAPVTADTPVTTASDHTLRAVWEARAFTVTFDSRGGSGPVPASRVVTFASAHGPLADSTRPGYTFAGWFTAPDGPGERVLPETTVTEPRDVTLFARWAADAYLVTFDGRGGTTPAARAATFDAPYGALPVPIRPGFAFLGWWTTPEVGGVEVTAATLVATAAPHTLFARWQTTAPRGFARILPGSFVMGSPQNEVGRDVDEAQVSVTLSRAFWLGETEVTQGQWKALSGGFNPSANAACGDNCPVDRVSWWSTFGFANALSASEELPPCYTLPTSGCVGAWQEGNLDCGNAMPAVIGGDVHACLGYRLPTEAEWEYAARAGTTTATYAGNLSGTALCVTVSGAGTFPPATQLASLAWYTCSADGVQPVRGLAPNAWGLHDMLGNVFEWTWDRYGSAGGLGGLDPQRVASGTDRVYRGGAWMYPASLARAAFRANYGPGNTGSTVGFRLARTVAGGEAP